MQAHLLEKIGEIDLRNLGIRRGIDIAVLEHAQEVGHVKLDRSAFALVELSGNVTGVGRKQRGLSGAAPPEQDLPVGIVDLLKLLVVGENLDVDGVEIGPQGQQFRAFLQRDGNA